MLDCDLIPQRLVLRVEGLEETGAQVKMPIRKSSPIRPPASRPLQGTGLLP